MRRYLRIPRVPREEEGRPWPRYPLYSGDPALAERVDEELADGPASRPSASTDAFARLIGPVVVVDTSGLIAAVNDRSSLHRETRALLDELRERSDA